MPISRSHGNSSTLDPHHRSVPLSYIKNITSAYHQPEHVEDDDDKDDDQQGGQGDHHSYDWHVVRLGVICRREERGEQRVCWIGRNISIHMTKSLSYSVTNNIISTRHYFIFFNESKDVNRFNWIRFNFVVLTHVQHTS